MIGVYGPWAASIVGDEPAVLSFCRKSRSELEAWRLAARQRLLECSAQPDAGQTPEVTLNSTFIYDGLHIEELSWQLPYGPRTEAIFLRPAESSGKLPGILALHDHNVNKYFGKEKIARTSDVCHPMMLEHYDQLYGGLAWANEIARRGYAVLVPDAFPFASRRVLLDDVPEEIRAGLNGRDQDIIAYNRWAADHETIMAKSLFCAGTTWPGVFLAEDQRALDVLCAREEVDPERLGCGGLSGGGLRTVYLGGVDARIRCAVCVGMMTTWRDFLLYKSYTHTWMVYVPLLPRDLDYPEILGLRVPLPTLVQNNIGDELFTITEMERADVMLRKVFDKAGADDRYRGSFFPGPHKFDRPMQAEAFDWFDRWLKESPSHVI
jgi:dienelactone hydrolase